MNTNYIAKACHLSTNHLCICKAFSLVLPALDPIPADFWATGSERPWLIANQSQACPTAFTKWNVNKQPRTQTCTHGNLHRLVLRQTGRENWGEEHTTEPNMHLESAPVQCNNARYEIVEKVMARGLRSNKSTSGCCRSCATSHLWEKTVGSRSCCHSGRAT